MNSTTPEWRLYRSFQQGTIHSLDDGYWKASVRTAPVGWMAHIYAYDGPEEGREFFIGCKTLDEAKSVAVAKIARQRS